MHCTEYSPKEKSSYPTCLLPWLLVSICKSVISMLLFAVVSSWFAVVNCFSYVGSLCKKGARAGLLSFSQ
jgi:hypothetical protein